MADAPVVLSYEAHENLKIGNVNNEIDQVWSDALKDPEVLSQLKAGGVDASILPQTGSEVISVKKEGEGLTADEIKIIVSIVTSFGPVVATILKDLWENKILPRIRANQGDDSIKNKKNNPEDQ